MELESLETSEEISKHLRKLTFNDARNLRSSSSHQSRRSRSTLELISPKHKFRQISLIVDLETRDITRLLLNFSWQAIFDNNETIVWAWCRLGSPVMCDMTRNFIQMGFKLFAKSFAADSRYHKWLFAINLYSKFRTARAMAFKVIEGIDIFYWFLRNHREVGILWGTSPIDG